MANAPHRKKYFSSVERLRIAQQTAVLKRKKQQAQHQPVLVKEAWLSPKSSMDSMRPRTAHSFKSTTLAQPRTSLASRPKRLEADVDEEQALRFLNLPEKVKRSNFTAEELVLLTESSERALGTPSICSDDNSSYRLTGDRNASLCSSKYRSSVSDDCGEDLGKDWPEMETDSNHSFDSCGGNDELMKPHAQPRLDSVTSLSNAAPPTLPVRNSSRPDSIRKSFTRKRAFSLAPIPLPPPTLMPAVPSLPASRSVASLLDGVRVPTTPSEPVPPTKHYKDSQARQKLREYLLSPEKFDEALEFGFPTKQDLPPRSSSLKPNAGKAVEGEAEELYVHEVAKDDDWEKSTVSPRTPFVLNDGYDQALATHSSVDSAVVLPLHSTTAKASPQPPSPEIHGREMTLRMTLTRSDLRAPDEDVNAFQRKDDIREYDPLALEALSVCDDHTGAHGAFAVTSKPSSSAFKRVWRNLRGL